MKFLLFTLEYPPFKGGISNYYENLVKYWPDDDLYVLANKQNDAINTRKITSKPLLAKFIFPKWVLGFYFLFKEVKNKKIDHVLVGHILPLGTITYLLSRILKFKYTVIMHGMDFQFATKTKRKLYLTKKILHNADLVICGNNYLVNLVKNKIGIKNIKILNPGIHKNAIQEDKQRIDSIKKKYKLKNKKTIISIGRLVKRKGFDKVIEVFPELLIKYPNLLYIVIGNGPDVKYLKEKANKFKESVLFLDNVNEIEKWSWLHIGDIFVMPSRDIDGDFEGFGIVYLEANLAKIPVIAGDSGGVRDAIKHNFNGILVNPENNLEIKNAILRLLKNEELRNKLVDNGYKRVINDFNIKKQIKSLYDIYNNPSL